jgi:hypothetical protein
MAIQPDQICFGLSEALDRESFACFLTLVGNKELADVLATRVTSKEIDDFVNRFMDLLRRYLSEEEYHRLFLQDKDPHKH